MGQASKRWSLVLAALALSGCAQLVVDDDGSRHMVGFMALTLPPPSEPVGADVVRMRTIGLALTRGDMPGPQIVLGYADTTIATLRHDSVVSRAALLRATNRTSTGEAP